MLIKVSDFFHFERLCVRSSLVEFRSKLFDIRSTGHLRCWADNPEWSGSSGSDPPNLLLFHFGLSQIEDLICSNRRLSWSNLDVVRIFRWNILDFWTQLGGPGSWSYPDFRHFLDSRDFCRWSILDFRSNLSNFSIPFRSCLDDPRDYFSNRIQSCFEAPSEFGFLGSVSSDILDRTFRLEEGWTDVSAKDGKGGKRVWWKENVSGNNKKFIYKHKTLGSYYLMFLVITCSSWKGSTFGSS